MGALEHLLVENKHTYKRIIGSFCAGSNVTGIITDVNAVGRLMHKHGGLAFFDYAGSGPYVKIEVNENVDGVYLSPHKFIGGPATCGIAIMKRKHYHTEIAPTHGGGGTVDYVSESKVLYSKNP